MLASEPGWDDLRQLTWSDVPRWDTHTLRELYAKEFPGVEEFLDQEFERLQEGLSPSERARLYGSYTLWTLLLITCEVAVGGGFSFFDAILDTVIVPFIPELVLSAHIRDRLRDIGARVDKQHRKALQTVLDRQAEQYETCWKRLIPPQDELERLRKLKRDVAEGKYYPQK